MKPTKPAPALRSLPRVFIQGAPADAPFEIPEFELQKLRKVLRLSTGDEIAVLPDNGSLLRCVIEGRKANPVETLFPNTEAPIPLTIAQALPKGDKIEEIIRACTEIGVARILIFKSDRTVVSWDERKIAEKLRRLQTIAREACEISFRTRIPEVDWIPNLKAALDFQPTSVVLSEREGLTKKLSALTGPTSLIVGPEGGWSPPEMEVVGDLGVTLGPRVLRVDHAAAAAAAILLLDH